MKRTNAAGEGPLNRIVLSLWDYANANGTFPVSELREHAEHIGGLVGLARTQEELLIYWLLRAYRTLGRTGYEEGPTDEETRTDLLHVLSNLGYDPNLSPFASELEARPAAFFLDKAVELWATHKNNVESAMEWVRQQHSLIGEGPDPE